jgi:hydroxysqualene synthase
VTPPPDNRRDPAEHYENFPVASCLCPPHLRRPIAAIYWFARTADDLADEGPATPAERLGDLEAYRRDLDAVLAAAPASPRWAPVFGPLAMAAREFGLPPQPLYDLLDAFAQDVRKTRDGEGYADRAELLAYCARSANPVGRMLLHLYGVNDDASLARSDAICSALQLINFWQDLGVDVPRGRYYLPAEDCRRFGLDPAAPQTWASQPRGPELVAQLCDWSRGMMMSGAPLVHRVPGRAGWELRLVVQGGLRILERIASLQHRTLERRPKIVALDAAPMLWRSLWM